MKTINNKEKDREYFRRSTSSNSSSFWESIKDEDILRNNKKPNYLVSQSECKDTFHQNINEPNSKVIETKFETATNTMPLYLDNLFHNIENVIAHQNVDMGESENTPDNDKYNSIVTMLSKYLEEFSNLLVTSKKSLVNVNSQKEAEINLITNVFQKLRQEIDLKEKLLKAELTIIAQNHEESLIEDIKYLSSKCSSLWKNINTLYSSATTSSSNISSLNSLLININADLNRTKSVMEFYNPSSTLLLPSLSWDFTHFRNWMKRIQLVKQKDTTYENIHNEDFRSNIIKNP